MKKLALRLDSLEVTSFETAPAGIRERGTVNAHAAASRRCIETYSVERCGDTMYFDCTLGCSQNTACPNGCVIID